MQENKPGEKVLVLMEWNREWGKNLMEDALPSSLLLSFRSTPHRGIQKLCV